MWSILQTQRRGSMHSLKHLSKMKSTSSSRTSSAKKTINRPRAFLELDRAAEPYRDPTTRVSDWQEIAYSPEARPAETRKQQASRCMDCGTPFCQTYTGCPVNNLIPEWNTLVYEDEWKEASDRLHKTNNFPEFTGRVCPAPCEGACVAGLVDEPVTIKNIEYAIVDRAFEEGWIVPRRPVNRTGLNVAVIGSGPAGLAAADEMNQNGHNVTVYERADRIGGLLMYGIPSMKLEKSTVDRRVDLLRQEGIKFVTNASVGDNNIEDLRSDNHAVVLCTGSTVPRDLGTLPGRELNGIHFAMEFLTKNQKRLLMTKDGTLESGWDKSFVTAEGKDVVVIGGGDTGTDCIGTAMRHRCRSITNFELLPQPPAARAASNPWPEYPRVYGVDYGHAECRAIFGHDPRAFKLMTKDFKGDSDGNLKSIVTLDAELSSDGKIHAVPDSEREWPCDLAILAMGFLNPEQDIVKSLNLETDSRNNISASHGDFRTSVEGVFAAGDCRRGQSLVVWAINEGRGVSEAVERYFATMNYLNPVEDAKRYAS